MLSSNIRRLLLNVPSLPNHQGLYATTKFFDTLLTKIQILSSSSPYKSYKQCQSCYDSGSLNETTTLRKIRYDRTSATRRMLQYDQLIRNIDKLRKEEIEWQIKKYRWLKKKHELLQQSNGLLTDTSYQQLKIEKEKLIEEREKWVKDERNWADEMRNWIDFEIDMHRTDMREVENHEIELVHFNEEDLDF